MRYRAYPGALVDGLDAPSDWGFYQNAVEDQDAEIGYEILRDTVIAAFNPREDDIAEIALVTEAVDRAWLFIIGQPCTCPPGAAESEAAPCRRCEVLGRACDTRLDR